MPCNASYMEPNRKEQNSQEVAKFLVYAMEYLGKKVPKLLKDAAKSSYGNPSELDNFTEQLCTLINNLNEEDKEFIVYNAHSKTSRRLADWWEAHEEADAKRIASESSTCTICRKSKKNKNFSKATNAGMKKDLICNSCYPIPLKA